MKGHAALAKGFLQDEARADWHDETLWWIRQKRDLAARQLPEWEQLRELASQIKDHTLSRLGDYLEDFERNAGANGVHVHWASDAKEHNRLILEIVRRSGGNKVVKSKSMLTEECHLNKHLKNNGIEVVDTDLGERIVQLRREPPSHIVLPAIHLKKGDVAKTFHEFLGTDAGNADPQYLARAAREHLREKFVNADVAITGVNFAIADSGAVVVCTNEGNADMGVHSARLHIACMGIEKVIPSAHQLAVYLRLLARSATGQPITTYTSHYLKPGPGKEMHIIIVDNGRSRQLASPDFRNSLKCIRCAACLNTCPVYRRSGGYSYHSATAGPIGSVLNPNLDPAKYADLPFASSLCGSCTHVCPVKIDLHDQLWKWRQVIMAKGYGSRVKKAMIKGMAFVLSRPVLYRFAGKSLRIVIRKFPFLVTNRMNPWYKQRDMPKPGKFSFREWYINNNANERKN